MTFWDATTVPIQIWRVRVISMEFLRSFLRRHFAGKPVVAWQMSAVFSGSCFSMQCIMYWLIMNNRITLKKLRKKTQNWDVTKKRNRKRARETGNWKKGKKWKNWWWRYWWGQPRFKLGFCHELAFFYHCQCSFHVLRSFVLVTTPELSKARRCVQISLYSVTSYPKI